MNRIAKPKQTLQKRTSPPIPRPKKQVKQRDTQAARAPERAAPPKSQADGGVAAVDRALAILGAFESGDMSLPLAELAQRTTFYKSTILRLAQSLIRHGYLQRLENGSYQIGPAPLMLAALYQRSLRLGDVVLPVMHELAEQTGESMSMYSRHGDIRVCLHRVDSKHAVRDHVREGDVLPLERGSGGRVLLAFGGAKGELVRNGSSRILLCVGWRTRRGDRRYFGAGLRRRPDSARCADIGRVRGRASTKRSSPMHVRCCCAPPYAPRTRSAAMRRPSMRR